MTASPLRRVEVSRRLVGQQDQRLAGDGAGHGHALLLTARKLAGQMLRAMPIPTRSSAASTRCLRSPPSCRGT